MPCNDSTPPLAPLTGLLNTRDLPAAMTYGQLRWRANFSASPINKLCRRAGWRRLGYTLDTTATQNLDLHSQLLDLQSYYAEATPPNADSSTVQDYPPPVGVCGTTELFRSTPRQPVTMLFGAVSTEGNRRLLAATQNRIYVQRATAGNWEIVSDDGGGDAQGGLPERRYHAAQVNDAVVFTNGFNAPTFWTWDGPVQGCAMQRTAPVPTLADIGLTTARVVTQWKGIVFFMNVEMDSARVRHRVVWGDSTIPLNFIPGDDSIAGFQDLDYGEAILAARELGDFLFIFTTLAIWQVAYVGGDQVFQFVRKYSSDTGGKCLAFPNTLVSTGDSLVYMGRDGIYTFNQFLPEPDRPDWIHAASGYLFSTLNTTVCEAHVGVYDPGTQEIWFSWVETGQTFPRKTFAVNVAEGAKACDYIDHGFTAFATFTMDERPDIDAFVLENCICSQAELDELNADGALQEPLKMGVNCVAIEPPACTLDTSTPVWTYTTMDLDGRTIEDYFQEQPDADTMCSYLLTLGLDDLCDECNARSPLVMASATDWCLKEIADVYYRERCTVFTACGTYVQDGYTSLLRTGPIRGKVESQEIKLTSLGLIFSAEAQTTPTNITPRIGWSATPNDPNNTACAIRWRDLSSKPLRCVTQKTSEEHEADATMPFETMDWQAVFANRCLYIEFRIEGTGGGSCFAAIEPDIDGRVLQPNA